MNLQLSKIIRGTLALAVGALVFSGCSESDPKLVPPPPPAMNDKDKVVVGGESYTFNPKVDILFVVDDSGSMETHQQDLMANIEKFTKGVAQNQILDYHFGVLTSSMGEIGRKGGNGLLVGPPNVIDRQTPDMVAALQENLHVGTRGSSQEMFFDPVQAALTEPLLSGENAGFYREDAHLAVIFITDADDQSDNLDPASYHKFLLELKKNDPKKVLHYGVFIPSSDRNCSRSGEDPPRRIEQTMSLFNGKSFGLCDPDFGQKLVDIADDLGNRVGRVMYLSRPADPTTISVTFGNMPLPNDADKGWVYDPGRNAIVFGEHIDWHAQPLGSQIQVTFIPGKYNLVH